MGGYILFSLFRKHPDIFSGLLLANTKALADGIEVRNNRFSTINQLKENPDLNPLIDFHISRFFTKESHKSHPDMIESVKKMMRQSTVAGIIQAQRAMAKRLDSFGLLSQMDFPVSIITGKDDELISIEECRQMHHIIKDCKLFIPDFVKVAQAYCANGIRVEKKNDLDKAFQQALQNKNGPFIIDIMTVREENVWPMVPGGASLDEMLKGGMTV